jgi:hypothetical protein
MASTIQKRSGTTRGARSVIVPKDNVSGDVLDPLRRSPAPPFASDGEAASKDGGQSLDDAAIQQTPPSNELPSGEMSAPKVSVPGASSKRVNDTMAGDMDEKGGWVGAKKGDRQTLMLAGALIAVLVCFALVFYLIYSSIMHS